ncbi:unnamed protein product [Linum tenue]|uniref:DUF3741 domain-containing protein n=1 Tax=Linum tenue TaxID=586396 RepID=A0AAV0KSZ6_9ROSI|nr:unnamed protein product [Linum tenue]
MSNESGCFSAVVRLLLCKGHLQTHPSDPIPDPILHTNRSCFIPPKDLYFDCQHVGSDGTRITPAAPPGIVARLMGLDSLPPATTSSNWRRSSAAAAVARHSVSRSRSVNFVDYLLHIDLSSPSPSSNAQHRRVRTSASFREEILAAQDHPDFFLLYLEDTNKAEKSKARIGSKVTTKSEIRSTISGQSKQRREEGRIRSKGKEMDDQKQNEQRKKTKKKKVATAAGGAADKPKPSANARGNQVSGSVVVGSVSQLKKKVQSHRRKCPEKPTVNQKEVMVESNFMKKIKNQKPIAIDDGIQTPASRLSGKKRAAKQSRETKGTLSRPSLQTKEAAGLGGDYLERKQPSAVDTARYVAQLVEEDVKGTVWIQNQNQKKSNGHDDVEEVYEWLEEICVELGQQLLDLLLGQAVEQLV